MNKPLIAAAFLAHGMGTTMAQSVVSVYGAADSYVETARITGRGSFKQVSFNGVTPNRLGVRGSEDIGGGWRAHFVLEHGFAVDTGSTLLGGRMWGRQAWVALASARHGELRIGRQLTPLHFSMFTTDIDAFSATSPAFAVYQSNLDQSRQDNQVSYWLPKVGGFSGAVSVSAGEGTPVAPGQATSWVPLAGVVRPSTGALLRYQSGTFDSSVGYHRGGQQTATGRASQQVVHGGANHRLSAVQIGVNVWAHRNELPNGTAADVRGGVLGLRYFVTDQLYWVGQGGRFEDNGVAYASGTAKARGSTTYYNVGVDYLLSKRTGIYARAARVEDRKGGFNGRTNASLIGLFGPGTHLPAGGTASTLAVGMRHSF